MRVRAVPTIEAALVLCAIAGMTAGVSAQEPLIVKLDWSNVPDSFIARCHLQGLQNLLLQHLVEDGYAVAAESGSTGLSLTLTLKGADELEAEARRRATTSSQTVHIPTRCNSTIAVDIVHAARLALAAVVAVRDEATSAPKLEAAPPVAVQASSPEPSRASSASPAPSASPSPASSPLSLPSSSPPSPPPAGSETVGAPARQQAWRVGAGAVVGGRRGVAPALRATMGLPVGPRVSLGPSLALDVRHSRLLWVIEPVISAQASYRLPLGPALSIDMGVDAGVLTYLYYVNAGHRGADVTARFGLPLCMRTAAGVGGCVMPFVRLTPVLHTTSHQVAYQAGYLGVDLSLALAGG